jgi:hypothetical protein
MLHANILKAVVLRNTQSVGMGNGVLTLDTHLIESSLWVLVQL